MAPDLTPFVTVATVPLKIYTINICLSSKIYIFYFGLFGACYFDIEMLVVCFDVGSFYGVIDRY